MGQPTNQPTSLRSALVQGGRRTSHLLPKVFFRPLKAPTVRIISKINRRTPPKRVRTFRARSLTLTWRTWGPINALAVVLSAKFRLQCANTVGVGFGVGPPTEGLPRFFFLTRLDSNSPQGLVCLLGLVPRPSSGVWRPGRPLRHILFPLSRFLFHDTLYPSSSTFVSAVRTSLSAAESIRSGARARLSSPWRFLRPRKLLLLLLLVTDFVYYSFGPPRFEGKGRTLPSA